MPTLTGEGINTHNIPCIVHIAIYYFKHINSSFSVTAMLKKVFSIFLWFDSNDRLYPSFVIAHESKVLKIEGSAFGIRPSIYTKKE